MESRGGIPRELTRRECLIGAFISCIQPREIGFCALSVVNVFKLGLVSAELFVAQINVLMKSRALPQMHFYHIQICQVLLCILCQLEKRLEL